MIRHFVATLLCAILHRERLYKSLKKRVARDKNLRPCLPLKPQEKELKYFLKDNSIVIKLKATHYR